MCKNKGCMILGSGFGLYGYLPAAVHCGYRVFLPERYRMTLNARKELICYGSNVVFVEREEDAFKDVSLCIIAKRPEDQYILLPLILEAASVKKVLIEKPVAPNPTKAWECYNRMLKSGKDICIGYSFFYTKWGESVCKALRETGKVVQIKWLFRAHHFRCGINSWKRYTANGGGVLRFYGIQLIGILAVADKWEIASSVLYCTKRNEAIRWEMKLFCGNSNYIDICVDSNSSIEKFVCRLESEKGKEDYSYLERSPFLKTGGDKDCRIVILEQIINNKGLEDVLIKKSIELWELIEENSKIVIMD